MPSTPLTNFVSFWTWWMVSKAKWRWWWYYRNVGRRSGWDHEENEGKMHWAAKHQPVSRRGQQTWSRKCRMQVEKSPLLCNINRFKQISGKLVGWKAGKWAELRSCKGYRLVLVFSVRILMKITAMCQTRGDLNLWCVQKEFSGKVGCVGGVQSLTQWHCIVAVLWWGRCEDIPAWMCLG